MKAYALNVGALGETTFTFVGKVPTDAIAPVFILSPDERRRARNRRKAETRKRTR